MNKSRQDQLPREATPDNLMRYYFTVGAFQRLNFHLRLGGTKIYTLPELETGLSDFVTVQPAKQRLRICLQSQEANKCL